MLGERWDWDIGGAIEGDKIKIKCFVYHEKIRIKLELNLYDDV